MEHFKLLIRTLRFKVKPKSVEHTQRDVGLEIIWLTLHFLTSSHKIKRNLKIILDYALANAEVGNL